MRNKVFVSYRRQDSAADARSIYERLSRELGSHSVFMDIDTIEKGHDFRLALDRALKQCSIVLVLIGRGWVGAKNSAGERRLDVPNDFVRMEIATAFRLGLRVIPIYIDGQSAIHPEELPEELRELSYRQALSINHASFSSDMNGLIKSIGPVLKSRRIVIPISLGILACVISIGGWLLWQHGLRALAPNTATAPASAPAKSAEKRKDAAPINNAQVIGIGIETLAFSAFKSYMCQRLVNYYSRATFSRDDVSLVYSPTKENYNKINFSSNMHYAMCGRINFKESSASAKTAIAKLLTDVEKVAGKYHGIFTPEGKSKYLPGPSVAIEFRNTINSHKDDIVAELGKSGAQAAALPVGEQPSDAVISRYDRDAAKDYKEFEEWLERINFWERVIGNG